MSIVGVAPFRVRAPSKADDVERFAQSLDPGESEALALAGELGLTLLIDERAGRSMAAQAGIATVGTLGTLLLAKQSDLVPSIRPLMEFLRDRTQFRITPEVFADMLRRAGE